jgi:hypothetical protein
VCAIRARGVAESAIKYARWRPPWLLFRAVMADEELHLIGPDEIAYRLDLTPGQLKITWTALKSFLDDFGHDERDVGRVVREVLDKLPDEHAIRSIDISRRRQP